MFEGGKREDLCLESAAHEAMVTAWLVPFLPRLWVKSVLPPGHGLVDKVLTMQTQVLGFSPQKPCSKHWGTACAWNPSSDLPANWFTLTFDLQVQRETLSEKIRCM